MKNVFILLSLTLAIGALTTSVFLYPQLPDQIPTHWNLQGKVDDYSSKNWGAFLLPVITLAMVGLFRLLPRISPKNFEVESFRRTYEYVMFLVIALLVYIHCFALYASLQPSTNLPKVLLAGIFLFFAFLGNVLGKVRRNFWIGVRTPWTLASEKVWNDTHRLAARLFFFAGVLGFITILAGIPSFVALILIGAAGLGAAGYSLVEYKQLERHGNL